MVHVFILFCVPDTYRIIIVTESGNVTVQTPYENGAAEHRHVRLCNRQNGEQPIWITYVLQFLFTCIPTLIIEGLILLLFGFKAEGNWKVFSHQSGDTGRLTAIVGSVMIRLGSATAFIAEIPTEILVLVAKRCCTQKF